MMSITPPPHQTEKPSHYTYLKEFRVNQCPLFLQHKCTQHRPFTCFYWHFSNQRRRRPIRKRDGTFNYSADSYCTKYDETTGICPIGDDCPYIHRNTGDTERRYHLRYYKTGTCIHETESRGNCVKNGPHCAFAHGSDDLRPPVYDVREQQNSESCQDGTSDHIPRSDVVNLAEKIVNEDPKWLDSGYVLSNYKTDICKRPPRLCRQGYACPQYHNPKDRRRNPKKFKYRSTPCPNVKQGDDWKDPSSCEKGDGCSFCHTRTEQQFHPEIYKSSKCHDMSQTGYCPRGPFCAFAHVEQEIRVLDEEDETDIGVNDEENTNLKSIEMESKKNILGNDVGVIEPPSTLGINFFDGNDSLVNKNFNSQIQSPTSKLESPISAPRSDVVASYSKAIGSERFMAENNQITNYGSVGSSVDLWPRSSSNRINALNSVYPSISPSDISKSVPPYSNDSFYTSKSHAEAGMENVFSDSICSASVDQKQIQRIWNNESTSSVQLGNDNSLFPKTDPLSIPFDPYTRDSFNTGGSSLPSALRGMNSSIMPSSLPPIGDNLLNSDNNGMVTLGEYKSMQEKCRQWENSWNQAKNACEAWRKEANDATNRAKLAEKHEKDIRERLREAESQIKRLIQGKSLSSDESLMFQQFDHLDFRDKSRDQLKTIAENLRANLQIVENQMWGSLWNN